MFNPSVRISGNITAGNRNFFGVSSVVLQGVSLGDDVTLGANSVLVRTPKDGKTYIGNPATLFDI